MRQRKLRTILACVLALALTLQLGTVGALADGPGGGGGGSAPGGGESSSSSDITWSGATSITSARTTTEQTYSSTTADQNAVLIDTASGVSVALNTPTVTKSGGTSASDNYSFYGINSAVMCKGGGTTTITGGTVTTSAAGANGVFSYGANNGTTNATGDGTTVSVSGMTITTTGDGSGGIMTTYGGTTVANNLTITTSGGSSAPIRTDRGGGWVTVTGGSYTSSGTGSPAIYSTAEVKVSNATLVSEKSEGVCIEGAGSIELTDCALTATNNTLNGNAQFYDTIMIYQSQSGDASDGTSAFTMTGGTLTSNKGHVFHVTNTTSTITLSGVTIVNNDSDGILLSVCDDGWSGASNSATVNATNQTLSGTMLVGSDSTLNLILSGTTAWTGTTSGNISNGSGTSVSTSLGTVNVTMDSTSTWTLTEDTTVTTLTNTGVTNYSNINLNGHTLTVGTTQITSTDYSGSTDSTTTTDEDDDSSGSATLTFTDSGITASSSTSSGYSISGTTLTISDSGTYTVTGSCNNGSIVVKKNTTGVVLKLSDLTLTSTTTGTAPIVCKSGSGVTIDVSGTNTLTDSETDTSSTDYEGAAIKVKSGGSVVITGDGTLNLVGTEKNGIKGAATAAVTVNMEDDGVLAITAANNGLASDGTVVVKNGTLNITAGNEGIKSEPDEDDTDSAGTVTISGGTIKIDTVTKKGGDGIQAVNGITISGGTFDIDAYSDGIQSNADLTITGGTFDIKTLNGYNSGSSFSSDTMSCKGLKASASDDDTDDATNTITISGGSFTLNTADDAVHSDGYIVITGGTFDIYSGDDGVHADTSLTLGTSGGTVDRDPYITVNYSYEGLEAGNVYIYSGKYYVYATDDGINAAGGSSQGTDPGAGGGNHFNPGGGPGGHAQQPSSSSSSSSSSYSLNIYGGKVYVNCLGDGLDSNGALNLTGGEIEVWSQSSGDNEPLDCDGTLYVKGATVFAAGCAGMGQASPASGSQTYKNYSTSISANRIVSVKNGSTTVYNTKAPKAASYVFFSAPSMSTSYTVSSASGSLTCSNDAKCNAWAHTWNSGVADASTGLTTYTCSVCGATETQTTLTSNSAEEEHYTASFVVVNDSASASDTATRATVDVFYTQDYTSADETGASSAYARSASTGEIDVSGSGQINFRVNPDSGYITSYITAVAEGSYNSLKGWEDTETEDIYRITKITGDITVTIHMISESDATSAPSATFSGENFTVTEYYTHDYSGASGTYAANVNSAYARNDVTGHVDKYSGDGQVNFKIVPADGYEVESVTVSGTAGTEYKALKTPSDTGETNVYRITKLVNDVTVTVTMTMESASEETTTDAGYTVTFSPENCTINTYYTQDYTAVSETGVTSAVSRDSSTGDSDSTGSGQVNFTVVPSNGYEVTTDGISISGSYKNFKDISEEAGVANTYRITKITSELTVTVTATAVKTLESISVTTNPTKTSYYVGDSFDPAGLVITATYSDKSTETITYSSTAGMTFSGFDSTSIGTKTITVTYGGKSATFTVTVIEDTVSNIAVNTLPEKTAYTTGENFDATGLVLTATYASGKTEDVSYSSAAGMTFSDFDSTTSGTKTVTVTYGEKTATFTVTVSAEEGYTVTFNIGGQGTVNVYYTSSASTSDETGVTTAYTRNATIGETSRSGVVRFAVVPSSGYDIDSVTAAAGTLAETDSKNVYTLSELSGDTTVTVIIKAADPYTATFTTDEHAKVNIYKTTNYTESNILSTVAASSTGKANALDSSGYEDISGNGQINFEVVPDAGYDVRGITITSSTDNSSSGFSGLKGPSDTGNDNTYRIVKITDDLTVNVATAKVESIEVTTKPTKTSYTSGQSLAPAGLVITVTYSDETTTTVAYDDNADHFSFNPTTLSGTGTKSVTVTYGGQSATFDVTVSSGGGGGGGSSSGSGSTTSSTGSDTTTTSESTDVSTTGTESSTSTVTNADGSQTTTSSESTTAEDGSSVTTSSESTSNTVTNADGSVTETASETTTTTETNADGGTTTTETTSSTETTTSTVTNADGSTTETAVTDTSATTTVTAEDGSKTSTAVESTSTTATTSVANADGSTTVTAVTESTATTKVTSTDANGKTATVTAETTGTKAVETTVGADGKTTGAGTVSSTTVTTDERGSVTSTAVTEGTVAVSTDDVGTISEVTTATTTTTSADGTSVSETTVTTDAVTTDGTTGTTVESADGETISAEANVSETALRNARADGTPINVPVAVNPGTGANKGPSVFVNLPAFSHDKLSVTQMPAVEINVKGGGSGVVAFMRQPGGSLKLVKESRIGSVIVPIEGSCELVIADNSKTFADVASTAWYADSVTFVTAREIFNGTGSNRFSPHSAMNRAMVAQIIYNYERSSTAGAASDFADVAADAWYADAVGWANAAGIVTGYGKTYGALDVITRQDLVTILYRYAKTAGYDTDASAVLNFSDANDVASYAADAMRWATSIGLIRGYADGTIRPTAAASRAEVAAIMQRFCQEAR